MTSSRLADTEATASLLAAAQLRIALTVAGDGRELRGELGRGQRGVGLGDERVQRACVTRGRAPA